MAGSAAADDAFPTQAAPVEIVGLTPVMGVGVERDKVPVDVQTLSAAEAGPAGVVGVDDLLQRRLGAVSVGDYQGNPLQPSLSFRGYTASPVLGEPQGMAVYQNGMRVNEAFGDVVNWDSVPTFAVERMQVLPGSNPVFGLNALGGAVSMRMKSGFTAAGNHVELAGGPYGRARMLAESGANNGTLAYYAGALAMNDDGWRQGAPSRLAQGYLDLGWRGDTSDAGLGVTLASASLGNNGSAPAQWLDASWSTAFTGPDTQTDQVAAVELRGSHAVGDDLSIQGSAYFRHLRTAVVNGNVSQFQDCGGGSAGFLCDDAGAPLVDRAGAPVATPAAPVAQVDNALTRSDGGGASAQVSRVGRLFGLESTATAGISLDGGHTAYTAWSGVGSFTGQRVAVADGTVLGGSAFTGLDADNLYGGAYVTDTVTLRPGLALTLAGRYNAAEMVLRDRVGQALNGDHAFLRFNPSAGLSWKVRRGLTLFADYSEANRVPTPAELSCADPTRPCQVPNAFAGDPPLRQVVSHSVELGARGHRRWAGGKAASLDWSVAAFFSNNQDDIVFVDSGGSTASGYFRNAGTTQRAGIEASISGRRGPVTWFASYALVRATFESAFAVASPSNPGADTGGAIHVRPGDAMPGQPLHSLKAGLTWRVTPRWSLGGDVQAASGVYLRGDEANLQQPTQPYAVLNGEADYRLTRSTTLFARADNLLGTRFATAGVYSDASAFGGPAADRFLTPGAPFTLWAGLDARF